MSFWVHVEAENPGDAWVHATAYEPPLPRPVAGHGYARYFVEFDEMVFEFSSLAELRVCIEVLSKKNLPTSVQLSDERPGTMGPNSHWLSRLPGRTKAWKFREPAVAYLQKCLEAWSQ
ncbi:MAG: hypothetical protein AAFY60_15920 [Myxococcota bacterium]